MTVMLWCARGSSARQCGTVHAPPVRTHVCVREWAGFCGSRTHLSDRPLPPEGIKIPPAPAAFASGPAGPAGVRSRCRSLTYCTSVYNFYDIEWKYAHFVLKHNAAKVFVDSRPCVDGFLGNYAIPILWRQAKQQVIFPSGSSSIAVNKPLSTGKQYNYFCPICMSDHIAN